MAGRRLWVVVMTASLPSSLALEVRATELTGAFFNVSSFESGWYPERNSQLWAQHCLDTCISSCMSDPPELGRFEKMLGWSDDDDCSYRCVHACLFESIQHGGKLYKYKGKWPHTRVLGLTEPFSTAFSLVNAAAHFAGFMIITHCKKEMLHMMLHDTPTTRSSVHASPPLAELFSHMRAHVVRLQAMSVVWILAWLASSLFHARDNWLTERLDYFGGNLAMAFMLYVSVLRSRLHATFYDRPWVLRMFGAALGCLVTTHMALNYRKMNYTLNMYVMIGLLIAHTLTWAHTCMTNRAAHNKLFYMSSALTFVAGMLEIKDFPPVLGSLDAHALWHAATPTLTYIHYLFLATDVRHTLAQKGKEKDK